MTREEAILILQEEAEFLYGDVLPGDAPYNKTAFDMAIEALSAPQTDLINRGRADAIEAIQNAYCKPCKERGDDYNEVRCRVCEYDNAIMQIDALPSVDKPQGEWISNHDGSWNCSECGLRVFIYAKGNYCPNCGAKMKGGTE